MKADINNSSFIYSVSLLRILRGIELITEEEYNKIIKISSEYYDTKIYCV